MQILALSLGALLTAVTAWFNSAPETARTAIQIFGLFLMLDTLSGIYLAIRLGQLRSKVMRVSLVVKMVQYAMIVGIAQGAGILIKSWFPLTIAFGVAAANEMVSIIENVRKLENQGGVDVGHFKPLLRWLGHAFAEEERVNQSLGDGPVRERMEPGDPDKS